MKDDIVGILIIIIILLLTSGGQGCDPVAAFGLDC